MTNTLDSPLDNIEALRKRTNVTRMLDRPFFKHIAEHSLTKEQLQTFFSQYYVIVKTSYRMLAAGIISTPSSETDMIVHLVHFLETESAGVPNHLVYFHRWSEAFGVPLAALETAHWNPRSKGFEDTLMGCFHSLDALTKLAAQAAVEDCAAVLIDGLDRGFRHYPMNSRTYGYLMVHRVLENDEDGHSRWAIDALAAHPKLHERFDEVEATYQRIYQAFADVFDGIFDAWQHAAQPPRASEAHINLNS